MIFHDYTLLATGEIRSHRTHDSDKLEPAAVWVFTEMLREGTSFMKPVPYPSFSHIELYWTPDRMTSNAMATFYSRGKLMTSSALMVHEDTFALDGLKSITRQLLKHEPGPMVDRVFDLVEDKLDLILPRLPAIVTVPFPAEDLTDMPVIADMETCLAAAWFTRDGGIGVRKQ